MLDRRTVASGIVMGLLGVGATSCSRESKITSLASLREKAKAGGLNVGYIEYNELTSENGEGQPPSGFLPDLFHLFAVNAQIDEAGIKWQPSKWDTFALKLESGAIDFSIAGTFITPERAKKVAFTSPLFKLGNGAAVLKSKNPVPKIASVMDLDQKGIRIAVVSGEQSDEFTKTNFKNATVIELAGPDLSAAPQKLVDGGVDVAMSDQFVLRRFIAAHPQVIDVLANKPFSTLDIAWAVAKTDGSLLSEINPIIETIVKSPAFRDLKAKYPVVPFIDL